MSPRKLQWPHSAALAALLFVLPIGGYLMSQPVTMVTAGLLSSLGFVVLLAVAVASAYVGAAEGEVKSLRSQLAEQDGTIERLNEVVREDERIVEVLSSWNQSIKGELVANAFHSGMAKDSWVGSSDGYRPPAQ